jgi:F-type H+-transporting ATPase subunit b
MNFLNINTVYATSEEPVAEVTQATEEHTTAPAGEESVAASLGLNGQLFLFQLINFAIVAVIIWFLILKPLTKTLNERKKIIDESLDKAKEVDANLQMAQVKFQEKLDEAKVEANKIIERAHGEAEQLGVSMKEKAKKEIELLIDQAKRNIQIEKDEVLDGIKRETVNLVVAAVEKILNEKLDNDKDKKLIEESIKGLQS